MKFSHEIFPHKRKKISGFCNQGHAVSVFVTSLSDVADQARGYDT
jgi:hypothetical protein